MSIKNRVLRLVAFAAVCLIVVFWVAYPEFYVYFALFLVMNVLALIIFSILYH